jgi:hypothetical protein
VSILKREKLLEVPVTVEKIWDLIRVLGSVWMVKVNCCFSFYSKSPHEICCLLTYLHVQRIIMDCIDVVNSQVQNSTDFKQELVAIGTETPPNSIVLPWSCDTK